MDVKAQINKWDYINLKTFRPAAKGPVDKVRRQEKAFAKHVI